MWYKLKRILIYPDGVTEKQVYPAWWKPWANTIAYYPLKEDVLDYSWNWNNWSWNPNSFTGWVANYSWNSTTLPYSIIYRDAYTVSVWVVSEVTSWFKSVMGQHSNSYYWFNILFIKNNNVNYITGNSGYEFTRYYDSNLNWWKLLTCTSDWSTTKLYINWELKATWTYWWKRSDTLYMWYDHWYNGWAFTWKISELIVEDKVRTAQKIQDYYNQTKSNYWL